MLTIRGSQGQLTKLNDTLNTAYGYPNLQTQTNNYSTIQIEFGTNEYCMVIFAKDRSFAEKLGLKIEEGYTIKSAPIEEPIAQIEEKPVIVEKETNEVVGEIMPDNFDMSQLN